MWYTISSPSSGELNMNIDNGPGLQSHCVVVFGCLNSEFMNMQLMPKYHVLLHFSHQEDIVSPSV